MGVFVLVLSNINIVWQKSLSAPLITAATASESGRGRRRLTHNTNLPVTITLYPCSHYTLFCCQHDDGAATDVYVLCVCICATTPDQCYSC